MITTAEVKQLNDDHGMFFNLHHDEYRSLGVWTSEYRNTVLYKMLDASVWFIQFYNERSRKEFEEQYNRFEILYDSEKEI